jgi:2-polyprenyl-3-methyl-5-hydroxy-6-metoxy-1,4-benzoquinol methylase
MSHSSQTDRPVPLDHLQAPLTSLPGRCLVCGARYGRSRLPGLMQCGTCGFISADLDISETALTALYGEDYFHGQEYADYIAEEESLRLNFRDRIATLRRLIPDLATADLFEIGCAYGFFLDEIRAVVRKASGVDISADAVRYAVAERGVDARQGDYLAMELGRSVDVITMWDTIEHLKRPDLFIEKAASDLKSGGMIAITTGDIGSLNARLRGRRWRMIHPPTHLHYFSTATLGRLLDRHGFEVVSVTHPGNSRNIRAIAYFILVLQMKRQALYERFARLSLSNYRMTANLYDIMYVIARRR